jgi:ABC-type branched-subunit amino acid transport system ATPase component
MIVVLQLGRVVAAGPPAEVWKNPVVVEAYLGES